MSFWTVVKQDASDVENALVTGGKNLLTYIDNVVVVDIEPALEVALKTAIEQLGQEAVALLLGKASS